MATAAVFLADGFEEIEAVTVIDYLRRAGVSVTVAGISVNVNGCVTGAHSIKMQPDVTIGKYIAELRGSLPDAVYLPGGMPGAVNLSMNSSLVLLIKDCFAAGKWITALCAAPIVVLAKAGVLQGKKFTCYPGMERTAAEYAGETDPAETLKDAVYVPDVPFVTDANVITGRGPGAAEQFAMELVRALCGADVAEKVHDTSMQR